MLYDKTYYEQIEENGMLEKAADLGLNYEDYTTVEELSSAIYTAKEELKAADRDKFDM